MARFDRDMDGDELHHYMRGDDRKFGEVNELGESITEDTEYYRERMEEIEQMDLPIAEKVALLKQLRGHLLRLEERHENEVEQAGDRLKQDMMHSHEELRQRMEKLKEVMKSLEERKNASRSDISQVDKSYEVADESLKRYEAWKEEGVQKMQAHLEVLREQQRIMKVKSLR